MNDDCPSDGDSISAAYGRLERRRRLNFLDEYHLHQCPDYIRAKWIASERGPTIMYKNGGKQSLATWFIWNKFRYRPEEPR